MNDRPACYIYVRIVLCRSCKHYHDISRAVKYSMVTGLCPKCGTEMVIIIALLTGQVGVAGEEEI